MPSLQQLRYLIALADSLNFSRAAERLNVSQPTLSMQIRELETRLGTVLFERTRARVLLTPSGAEITRRARDVIRTVEDIRDVVRADQGTPFRGALKLGVMSSIGAYLLTVAMPKLREDYPSLRLHLREDQMDMLSRQLTEGVHDALILTGNPRQPDFVSQLLMEEDLQVVLPSDHPLAGKPMLRPDDLKGETLLSMDSSPELHGQIGALCRQTGASFARDYEGTTLDTVRQMVATGMGLGLLPALYIRSEVLRETLVVARPLSRLAPSRKIFLVWRRSSPLGESYNALGRSIITALKNVTGHARLTR